MSFAHGSVKVRLYNILTLCFLRIFLDTTPVVKLNWNTNSFDSFNFLQHFEKVPIAEKIKIFFVRLYTFEKASELKHFNK